MSALREIAAKFGIEFDDAPLQRGNEAIGDSVSSLRMLGATLAGSAIIMGVRNFVEGITEVGSELNDASDRLGVGVQDLQELQYAFGQAGVRGQQVNAALTGLSQRMEQAHAGTGPAASAFRALGLTLTDAHGQMLPVSDMMSDIAREMGRVQDPARRVQLATQLFGGAGRRLVGVLHEGAGGLEEMRGQLQELGGGLSDDGVAAADEFGDASERWRVSLLSAKSTIATFLLPALTKLSDWFSHGFAEFTRFTRGTHVVELAFGALAGVALLQLWPTIQRLASAFWGMARAQAAAFIGIVGAILIIDDLITLFRGGRSVIGTFLDRMYGVGTSQRFVRSLREAWEGFNLALHDAWTWIGNLWTRLVNGASNAWTTIQGWVGNIRQVFTEVWQSIDEALGGALTRMTQRLESWFEPVIRRIRGLAQAIAHPFDAASDAVADALSSVADNWHSLVLNDGSQNAHNVQRTTQRAAGNTVIGPTTIHVTAPNPEAAARAVERAQERRRRATNDANHPIPPRE